MSKRRTTAGILQPDLKPWQRIDWPSCTLARVFKDWGQYYSRRERYKKALQYFDYSLEVCQTAIICPTSQQQQRLQALCHCTISGVEFCPPNYVTLNERSRCKQDMALSEEAVLDSEEAERLMHKRSVANVNVTLGKSNALFMSNRFEENLMVLNMVQREYPGETAKKFIDLHKQRVRSVLEDTVGSALNPFVRENWPFILDVARQRPATMELMSRPQWQQRQKQQECDVESILDKPNVLLSPMERARRRAAESLYNHHCLGNSAADVNMLRTLPNDSNFLNPINREGVRELSKLVAGSFGIVRKFMKMMHCRKPIYLAGEKNKQREPNLYRIQYETMRNCFRILREVRQLRRAGNFDRLADYVDHVMSTNIEMKTLRTLPWKWEFVQEIYNILALTLIDRFALPRNIDYLDAKNLNILYWLPTELADAMQQFGEHNEERNNRISHKLEQLEQRLMHSRYGIERSYLRYEMARYHLKAMHNSISVTMARKAVREARSCNSLVWRFNGTFLICQIHATFNRYARLKDSLAKAMYLALRLKSAKLVAYLELCNVVNEYQLETQRKGRTSRAKLTGSSLNQLQQSLLQQRQQRQQQQQQQQQQKQQRLSRWD